MIYVFAPSLARDSKFLRRVNRGCCIGRYSRRAVSTLLVRGVGIFQDFGNCWMQRVVCGVACRPEGLHLERRRLWAVELALGSSPFSVDLRKWKGLFVNGFECASAIPVEMEFLNC